jgi:predicted Zn-dependent protease with MMP-like domain
MESDDEPGTSASRLGWLRRLERGIEHYEEGRFARAVAVLERVVGRVAADATDEDVAEAHFVLGCALDRIGDPRAAETHFEAAERRDPEGYPRPPRLSAGAFDRVVARAREFIPAEFARYLEQVRWIVRDYPGSESPDPFVLGLYVGVPRTERESTLEDHLDTIYVYKRMHELDCLDDDELCDEVRRTVVHEIAHHFGLGEDAMGEYA